jgi:hypothetical protein
VSGDELLGPARRTRLTRLSVCLTDTHLHPHPPHTPACACAAPCCDVLCAARCPVSGYELLGLARLTRLTRLSAAAMSPELDNKQAALLTHLTSLHHLVSQ